MTLATQIRKQLALYVGGKLKLWELQEWLDGQAPNADAESTRLLRSVEWAACEAEHGGTAEMLARRLSGLVAMGETANPRPSMVVSYFELAAESMTTVTAGSSAPSTNPSLISPCLPLVSSGGTLPNELTLS